MEDAVLGMNILGVEGDVRDLVVSEAGTLTVQQTHHIRIVGDRAEGAGKMVLHERLLNDRVALIGLHELKQLSFVERPIDRRHNRKRLTAAEQVGVADSGLLVHTEHLGLLQNLTEIAQLRVGLQLLP